MSIQSIIDGLNYSKTGADVLSYVATDKTTTDHTLSYIFKKDCSLARSLKFKAICNEIRKENVSLTKNNVSLTENKDSSKYKEKKFYKKKIIKKTINVPSMAY